MKHRDSIFASLFIILIFFSCNTDSSEPVDENEFQSTAGNVNKFLFVGMVNETPSLYLYNLSQNNFMRFWYQPREIVINLSVSPDFMKAFFITALSIEEGGSLPLIRKVKLYLVDLKSMQVTHVKNYGIAGQIITNWEDENNFKIVINTLNKITATDINQTTQLFNSFGKLLIDESKTFDLLKDGYPGFSKLKRNYESPSGKYNIQVSAGREFCLLNNLTTKQQDTIRSSSFLINQIEWSYNDKYFAVNFTAKNNTADSSAILVYSLSNKKIQHRWKGKGSKNFFLLNDILIFDNGLVTESELIIFNCETGTVVNNICIKGGCGLKNIPGVLIYNAVE